MLQVLPLDRDWSFRRLGEAVPATAVELPHSAVRTDLNGGGHWQGECEYTRRLRLAPVAPGGRQVLYVGAAMHTARVLVDEVEVGRHEGGYLPFEVDLTPHLNDGAEHRLTLRLNNRDNPAVPPGKPLADLDFCWFGGLYREVELRTYPPIHITEAISAGECGGGGVRVSTRMATEAKAEVAVRVQVRQGGPRREALVVAVELADGTQIVASDRVALDPLEPGRAIHAEVVLEVLRPKLWSPDDPALHDLTVRVLAADGTRLDERRLRCGIRRIAFSRSAGFEINGRRRRLRGTNRHQEYPYLGYALPRAAQRRDARRIKEAGFDYVRLSHYPQSPDFLAACDELGIVVMNAIPGWQFIGEEAFRTACAENARQLIRRDRNHPCVVLWELSLNETDMDDAFMAQLHAIGHEELPGDQMFTCGWMDRYDVFIHSRQHGQLHRWSNGDKALVVAEYGDWEFYAANEGFDQKTGAGLHAAWSTSRHFRGDGERALRQQAWNHVTALDDTLASPAVLDGQWTVFDYVRGYHPVRAACGVMDSFRLPKFSYHFYRSQRDVDEGGAGWRGGATVFIASHWTEISDLRVVVFGNVETVELSLNGQRMGRHPPSRTLHTQHLPHPPFVFDLPAFVPGELEALGYVGQQCVARHRVTTPGPAVGLVLELDQLEIAPKANEPDVVIAHARLVDARGTVAIGAIERVVWCVEGDAELIGPLEVMCEAGIASTVVRVGAASRGFTLRAACRGATAGMAGTVDWWRAAPGGAEPGGELFELAATLTD